MESLYLLIPLSIVLAFAIGVAFWWFVHTGQFDDLEGPAYRILMDDDSVTHQDATEERADPAQEKMQQPTNLCDNPHIDSTSDDK